MQQQSMEMQKQLLEMQQRQQQQLTQLQQHLSLQQPPKPRTKNKSGAPTNKKISVTSNTSSSTKYHTTASRRKSAPIPSTLPSYTDQYTTIHRWKAPRVVRFIDGLKPVDEHKEWREQLKAQFERHKVNGETLTILTEATIVDMRVDKEAAGWFFERLQSLLFDTADVEYE
jgi:hypothetical protein